MESDITINISNNTNSVISLARKALSVISIEPAVFLCTLGYGLQMTISQVSSTFDMKCYGLFYRVLRKNSQLLE